MKINRLLIIISILILLSSCANIVYPDGGTKDIIPPVSTHFEPDNYSINNNSESYRIWFNEYLKLSSVNSQLVVSPPIAKQPNVKMKGKSIIIELQDSLEKNTTYTFNFRKSITDLTEGNILENFKYVLSTGNSIDSAFIFGKLIDSETKEPIEDAIICLYKENIDSLPLSSIPDFIAKTLEDGSFTISNIPLQSYKIFALNDMNSNMIYDLPNEDIAFKINTIDAIPLNSSDSLIDSKLIELDMFTEVDTVQRFNTKANISYLKVLVDFEFPLKKPNIRILNLDNNQSVLSSLNNNRDSLIFWLDKFDHDSLIVEIIDVNFSDTAYISIKTLEQWKSSGKGSSPVPEKMLVRCSNSENSSQEINKALTFGFNQPIIAYDFDKIQLFADSVLVEADFYIDSSNFLSIKSDVLWDQEAIYDLQVMPGAFTDIFWVNNDSIFHSFAVKPIESYGDITLNIHNAQCPLIIRFTDANDKLIEETYTNTEFTKISFMSLKPGNYKVYVIEDCRSNKQWDPGEYDKMIQAERIIHFETTLEAKKNFEMDYNWTLTND